MLTGMQHKESATNGTISAGTNIDVSHLQLRKIGNICTINGYAEIASGQSIAGANATILTVPEGYRPSANTFAYGRVIVYGSYNDTYTPIICNLNTNGTLVTNYGSGTITKAIYFNLTYII